MKGLNRIFRYSTISLFLVPLLYGCTKVTPGPYLVTKVDGLIVPKDLSQLATFVHEIDDSEGMLVSVQLYTPETKQYSDPYGEPQTDAELELLQQRTKELLEFWEYIDSIGGLISNERKPIAGRNRVNTIGFLAILTHTEPIYIGIYPNPRWEFGLGDSSDA